MSAQSLAFHLKDFPLPMVGDKDAMKMIKRGVNPYKAWVLARGLDIGEMMEAFGLDEAFREYKDGDMGAGFATPGNLLSAVFNGQVSPSTPMTQRFCETLNILPDKLHSSRNGFPARANVVESGCIFLERAWLAGTIDPDFARFMEREAKKGKDWSDMRPNRLDLANGPRLGLIFDDYARAIRKSGPAFDEMRNEAIRWRKQAQPIKTYLDVWGRALDMKDETFADDAMNARRNVEAAAPQDREDLDAVYAHVEDEWGRFRAWSLSRDTGIFMQAAANRTLILTSEVLARKQYNGTPARMLKIAGFDFD
jgi:hypothetical protein